MRAAILDENNVLIDAESKARLKKGEIDCGDLPADGSYKYIDGEFVRCSKSGAARSKIDRDRALYLLINAAVTGESVPQECLQWAAFYKKHFGA